ncbi:MAG: hypothetical protein H6570_00050 [Lewinellaceae bacterium]|nr:hypothetical protein [Lewinellaceae bacterium]
MKLIDLAGFLVYFCTYLVVLPVGIGTIFYRKLSRPLKVLYCNLIIVLFLDLVLLTIGGRLGNGLLYLFSLVDLMMMTWVFTSLIRSNSYKIIFRGSALLLGMYGLIDALYFSGLHVNGYSNGIIKLFIAILVMYYLSQLLLEDVEFRLKDMPMFWVSLGAILYNGFGFFDVFSSPIINYSQSFYLQYEIIWSVATIFMYIAYSWAFRISDRKL